MTRTSGVWLAAVLVAMPAVAHEAPVPATPPEPVPAATPIKPDPPAADPLLPLTPTVELRGRIQADAMMTSQSPQSKALLGDFENAYGFRRTRLGAQGTIGTSARWVAEVDFVSSSPRLRDTFVGLLAIPGVNVVQVGYFREPFSLEGATGSRSITFMERPRSTPSTRPATGASPAIGGPTTSDCSSPRARSATGPTRSG